MSRLQKPNPLSLQHFGCKEWLYTPEDFKEENKYKYHAIRVITVLRINGKRAIYRRSQLMIVPEYPWCFTIKGNTFKSFWNFIEHYPGVASSLECYEIQPTRFCKHRRIRFYDDKIKTWHENKNNYTWEIERSIEVYRPSVSDLMNILGVLSEKYIQERL